VLGAVTAITTGAGNNIQIVFIPLFQRNSNSCKWVAVTAGTTKNIYRNKIYNLQTTGALTTGQ
jgi:hypothetical protein